MTPGSIPPRSAVRRLATARFISYAGTAAAARESEPSISDLAAT